MMLGAISGGANSGVPSLADNLLLETGEYLLQETGDKILLDN